MNQPMMQRNPLFVNNFRRADKQISRAKKQIQSVEK
jgi:hypothetical protein